MRVIGVSRRSIIAAATAVFAFALVFAVGHYVAYGVTPDSRLIRSYVLIVALLGGIPTLLRLYRLGIVFIAGAGIGWIVDCVITVTSDPLRPSMQAGMYNLFVTTGFAIAAVIAEVVFRLRRSDSA